MGISDLQISLQTLKTPKYNDNYELYSHVESLWIAQLATQPTIINRMIGALVIPSNSRLQRVYEDDETKDEISADIIPQIIEVGPMSNVNISLTGYFIL